MSELTVPQIDFSSLGQLPQIYKQNQQDALRQQTLANLGQGGQVDANTLLRSGDLSLAQLGINLRNRQEETERQARQDAFQREESARAQRNADRSYGLQARTAGRLEDKTPAGFEANPDGGYRPVAGGPADPTYIARKSEVEAASNKPIPIETIGGTKFLVRNQSGGFSVVNPSDIGQPQGAVPQSASQQPQPFPAQGAAPFNPNGAQVQPDALPNQAPATVPAQAIAAPDIDAVDPKSGRREGYLQSLDPQIRDYIKKVADYEIDPRTTSVKGGMREKLMSAVAKYDPTYDQNSFGSRAKAIKDFATGPQGNSVRSFDVAIDHLETLQRYAKAMDSGDNRLINTIRNHWREATGSELPTDVRAVAPIVGAEVSKAIIGSNNALADREELRRPLAISSSPAQLSGAIGAYKDLMAGQLKGLKKQYEDTTGKKDFDSRVRQGTREVLLGAKKEPVVIDGYTIKEH